MCRHDLKALERHSARDTVEGQRQRRRDKRDTEESGKRREERGERREERGEEKISNQPAMHATPPETGTVPFLILKFKI